MNETRTHIDLFSGIGGFALAARANGIETIQFVEIDQRCRDFLGKAWPGVAIHDDIKTFRWGVAEPDQHGRGSRGDAATGSRHWCSVESAVGTSIGMADTESGENDLRKHGDMAKAKGRRRCGDSAAWGAGSGVFLLTAGVPCQPASRAGKQRGTGDDRWLWPEALRVLEEVRPAWAIFENPPGIADLFEYGVQLEVDADGNAVGEVGTVVDRVGRSIFNETMEAIESKGYACRPFSVPACAVDAPHQRKRYWIVCRRVENSDSERGCGRKMEAEGRTRNAGNACSPSQGDMADVAQHDRPEQGREAPGRGRGVAVGMGNPEGSGGRSGPCESRPEQDRYGTAGASPWSRYVWLPCADGKVRRAPDDSFSLVDGLHRSVLGALGNSVVPQVAAEIIRAITTADGDQAAKEGR